MERVLEAVPAPACLLGDDGRVTAANERFASLAGSLGEPSSDGPTTGQRSAQPSEDQSTDDRERTAPPDEEQPGTTEPDESGRAATVAGVDPGRLPPDGSAVTRSVTVEGPAGSIDVEATLRRVVDGRPRDAAVCVLPSVDDGRGDPIPGSLLSVVEAMPVGAFVLRGDGSIGAWNAAMEDLLGWTKSDTLGERPPFVPGGSEEAWHAVRDRVYDGETVSEDDLRFRTADGATRTLGVTAGPIRGEEGVDGLVALASESVAGERRERQLELLDRVLRHNVRNEMNLVLGNLRRLHDRVEDPETATIVEETLEAAGSVLELSEKARTLKEVAVAEGRIEPLPVTDLVADVVERYRERFPTATIEFRAGLEVTGRASPLLEVAVENLVENAIVHNEAEPHVEVTVETAWNGGAETVEVTVADDGPQIPEHERRVLAEEHEDVLRHGSGIGLWLVYWIVKESDGELVYRPRDPAGNELTIRIPRGVTGVR